MNFTFDDATKEQRILKKLKEDYVLVKSEIDGKRHVSRPILVGRIVCFLRRRHQVGKNVPLTLHQILTGIEHQYVDWNVRYWLYTIGVPDHQKITTVHGGLKFIYKPTYDIKTHSELISLLKRVYDDNTDGIPLDLIMESLPNAKKILEDNPTGFVTLTRISDEKKVLFHGKIAQDMAEIDKDFKNLATYDAVPNQCNKIGIQSDSDGSIRLTDCSYESSASKEYGLSTDSYETAGNSDDSDCVIVAVSSSFADSSKAIKTLDYTMGCAEVIICEPDILPNDWDDEEMSCC